jgi:two-component system NtrC family sensor kinase
MEANIKGLERVKKIVLDLRNFSRLDEAERKECHLAEGIESTLLFLGPLLQEHGVTVETDFAPLPKVLCSPGPLNQAISNILANAIQASQSGQAVRVSTRRDGDRFVVEVADHGAGIPAEHLAKVFDPFFTTKPVGSGTGLGLSIAHQVVAAHDGRIEIDSLPGSGTTVRILLPGKREGAGRSEPCDNKGIQRNGDGT